MYKFFVVNRYKNNFVLYFFPGFYIYLELISDVFYSSFLGNTTKLRKIFDKEQSVNSFFLLVFTIPNTLRWYFFVDKDTMIKDRRGLNRLQTNYIYESRVKGQSFLISSRLKYEVQEDSIRIPGFGLHVSTNRTIHPSS